VNAVLGIQYDAAGNLTAIGGFTFAYDPENRLVSSTLNSVTTNYVYDGDGLRTKKTVKKSDNSYAEKVTSYLYDRQHVILETDASDSIIARYVRGVNYIAYTGASEQSSCFMYNGHGDVVQTVSEAGEAQNSYDYDIWGNITLAVEQFSNAIRYAGQYYDAETGLYYLRARYYNPYIGRFISEDSYWGEDTNPLSLNLYTYCSNDPIKYTDPTGHWQQGDENLTYKARVEISRLTDLYYAAKTVAERKSIHEAANAIRNDPANKATTTQSSVTGTSFNKILSTTANKDSNGNAYLTASQWKSISTTKADTVVNSVLNDNKITIKEIYLVAASTPTAQFKSSGGKTSVKQKEPTSTLSANTTKIIGTVDTGKYKTSMPTKTQSSNQGMGYDYVAEMSTYNSQYSSSTKGTGSDVSFGSVAQNLVLGVVDAGKSAVEGLVNIVKHPVETAKGIGTLAIAYGRTPNELTFQMNYALLNEAIGVYNDFINGDANVKARYIGRGIGEIGLAVVGTKGVDKALKAIKITDKAGDVANVLNKADDIIEGTGKAIEGAAGVANLGKSYGKFGTVVENPGIKITGFSKHGVNQAITRGVTTDVIQNTVKNPVAVLSQRGGNSFAYISNDAVVVVKNTGEIITTYGKSNFDATVQQVLKEAIK
jgi:RHS repeat-associated protein